MNRYHVTSLLDGEVVDSLLRSYRRSSLPQVSCTVLGAVNIIFSAAEDPAPTERIFSATVGTVPQSQ